MSAIRALTPTSYGRAVNRLYPFVFTETPQPPVLLGNIPNLSAGFDSGTHQYELGDYFSGATSYAIDPAVEAGWTFNTTTGQLEIDTDAEATFGPYTVTATNAHGNTDSNAFTVKVSVSSVPSYAGLDVYSTLQVRI